MNPHPAADSSSTPASSPSKQPRKPRGRKKETTIEALEPRVMLSVTGDSRLHAQLTMPAALSAGPEMTQTTWDLVIVDPKLAKSGLLPAHESASTRVLILDETKDVLSQIGEALQQAGRVRGVHLLTHGTAGAIVVANQRIDAATLASRAKDIAQWDNALTDDAVIALYGCDVAAGESGRAFVQALSKRSGATVAASTDLTGNLRYGGDWTLEYVSGDDAVRSLQFGGFDGVLATFTVTASGGSATHIVGSGASVVDAGVIVSSSDGAATYTSATVSITSNLQTTNDVLALPSPPVGFASSYNAATGVLTVTAAGGKTAAQFQSALRLVTYNNTQSSFANTSDRSITFGFQGASSVKTLAPDLPVDTRIKTRIQEAFDVIDAIGVSIVNANSQPYRDTETSVPVIEERITDLLYPNSSTLSGGNPVPELSRSVQPAKIGEYLRLKQTVSTYFGSAGTITNLEGLQSALASKLDTVVEGNKAVVQVDAAFTKPDATDVRRIDLTVTILSVKGDTRKLTLEALERDLNLRLGDAAVVQTGGGADIAFTISIDLAGHEYGGVTAVPANNVGINFTRLNAFAGYALDGETFDVEVGAIRGQVAGATGYLGARIPVNLGGGGNTRTLGAWATNGSDYAGFGTATGVASIAMPISASIGGAWATHPSTKITYSDSNLFDGTPPTYVATQFEALKYFAAVRIENVIDQILRVGDLYDGLAKSNENLFGVEVPFLDGQSMGELFDFGSLFDAAIGSKVDIYQPLLNTPGRDQLTDYRLPLSSDTQPKPANYSDLRAGFKFGVVLNEQWPVRTITVDADGTRNTLGDLVSDLNAAFVAAGVAIQASNVKDKISLIASDVAVQRFAIVPLAPDAGRLNPLTPPGDLSTVPVNTPQYYTVTGSTSGTVTGTNYYKIDSALAAAAVHAGILANGETGVVKFTRLGTFAPALTDSVRNGVTSGSAGGNSSAYLIESAVSDIRRLGLVAYDQPLQVLETLSSGAIRATLPLQANLPASGSFKLTAGSNNFTINVPDNGRSSILDTLGDVQSALAAAGVGDTTLDARLVDAAGNVLEDEPAANTDYFLQLYIPEGSAWTTFTISPTADQTAHMVVPLGFIAGDVASRPRPAALTTFQDFADNDLFPGITITPVYDNAAGTVTLEFTAADSASPSMKAAFDLVLGKLGKINADNANLAFTPVITSEISFGLQFKIGAESPISIASGNTLPANGRLTSTADFAVDFVLSDQYRVSVAQGWTSANNTVQDLIGDLNRALMQVTNSANQTVDITSTFIARRVQDGSQFELLTASKANAGVPYVPTHTNGVLSSDLVINFSHDSTAYQVTVKASDTTDNTTFADLLVDLNAALGSAVTSGQQVSLVNSFFFTTISSAGGGGNNNVYLYATKPANSSWPASIVLTAERDDSTVTELGFDDSAESDVSIFTARGETAPAKLVAHSNGKALADGSVDITFPSFAGSVPYGFNTLDFAGTSGGVTARAKIDLVAPPATVDEVSGNLLNHVDRTLSRSNGTGNPRAALVLEDITSDSATIDEDATIDITIGNIAATTVTEFVPIGVPIPVPGQLNGVLSVNRTVNFLHENAMYAVTVTAGETAGNTTFAQLAAQFNAKLSAAAKTVGGVTTTVDASDLFQITSDTTAGQVVVSAATKTANPNFATVTFLPTLGAFGEIAAQGSFGLATVADSLTEVIPLLDALQTDLDLFSAFELPLVNAKVNSLIDIKGELLTKIDALRNISISSPSQIAQAVAQALGIPNNYVGVMYDTANNAYRIDVQWETGVATAKAMNLSLADFYRFTGEEPPAGLTSFNDSGSSSPLDIKIKAITTLALGIDLTDPNAPRTFLYGHDGSDDRVLSDGTANGTSVELQVEASADDISFTAALGAFGIFVKGGSANLGGAARTFGDDPIYTFNESTGQLHFARDTQAAILSVTLGEVGEKYYLDPTVSDEDAYDTRNYESAYSGTVEANLPLFTPTEFINPFTNRQMNVRIEGQGMTSVTPGGNIFQLHVGDLQSYADASLNLIAWQRQISDVYALANGNPLDAGQQETIDDLQGLIDGLKESEVLTIFTPDVDDANSGVRAPTLLDLVRDPAILVDGIDVALGAIETGLSALDNLNIPIIGSVLGDAVDGVFDWRRGWLLDLKHDLRGQGEAFFETLKDNVYEFLGPAGLDILLKDNGVRSVDGMIKADSRDDVTLDFLDEEGNKLTGLGGYGAEAMEFKVRLGQVLLDTGTDISFNFDALQPALSLGIKGGLTFKLGWDMTIGFGISLSDGFYVVTDSDPVANELELRFEAGLSGEQVGFTVAERAQSITGWSVKDAGGSWVRGPRQGDGSTQIIDVMPVDADGNDYDFNQGLPPLPDECAAEVEAGQPQRVYWVVAMADDYGDPQPAYLDQLGQYRAMAGDDWSDVNNGDDSRNPDMMVQFNQTAPFAAYGSLFAFNLTAIDNIRTGLAPLGDAEYFYDGTVPQITSGQRNDPSSGVNRNNQVPTRIAGRIGVNIKDPSADAESYVARPGPTVSGFMLMDGSTVLGGEPVLDDAGALIPVRMVGDDWYVLEPEDADDPSSDLVESYLINEDQSANRITFSEIQEAGTSIFELKLNAEAVVNLKLTLSVSDNANIPRITAELNIDWRTDAMKPPANPFATTTEQKRDLIPEVGINNIRLDLGSFLTKFIKPVAEQVDKTFKPLDPLIDVLNAAIPVLSDIAGRPIKLTTLLYTFGGPKGKAVATLLEMVVLVRQLSGVMAAVPSNVNVYLPMGNFWLAKVGAGPLGQPGMGTQIYYDNNEVSAPSITQRNQSLIANSGAAANSATNALGKLDQLDRGSSDQPGVSQQDRGGFTIPILQDPMTVFKLIMGQNVPLVTFSLPKLDFSFDQSIPIVKIFVLEVGLRVALQVKGQLAVGYDTYGLRLFKDSGNPQDLLEGFYVSDRANADGTGADVDEFYLRATIALYGGVDLYLAKAGIEGGFNFTATINLNDPDNDGKLRVMEAVDLVSYTGNPLDLADLHFSGDIYARYYYWVGLKIWTPWKTYKITLVEGGKTFARMQLFSFTREGRDGPPVLASKVTTVLEDGTEYANSLLVNVGPNSAKRISNEDPLKLKDAAESIKIWNASNGSSTVYVQYLNYSGSYTKTFTGISRVVVRSGEGNDTIDASGLNGIPVEFDGGAGNDTIYLGSGSSSVDSLVKGGLGNDVIRVTTGGRVRIEGDEGNDDITAGNGNATVDGGGGNDTITGGSGSNQINFTRSFGKDNLILNSAALVNLLNFIDSSLPLQGKLQAASSTIKAGDTNSATFDFSKVTEIRGSDGRDTFDITDPTTRAANSGKGVVISGGPGDDTYNINANDVTSMNADGITIDDDIEPLATATIGDVEIDDCGHIKKIKIDNPGLGYVQPPDVVITDDTGTGARAVASIDRLGKVTGIYVLAKGDNYVNPTVTLIRQISHGDKINFNSTASHTVAIDQQGNGATDHQLKVNNKAFKWVGYEQPGVVREQTHDVNEIDKVSITMPNAKLEINDPIDLEDAFVVTAKEFDQRAPITADTVKITTDRGFAADYPINATNNGDVVLRVTGAVDANDITTPAVASATVVDGQITGFTIVDGGSGYKFAPTVSIEDPRGAGALATATITNGVVTAITLINGGSGYLSTPAPRVIVAHPDSIQLNNNLSSSTVGSLPGDGDGRGTVNLRAEAGMINQSGDVFFPTGSQILWERGDYRYTSSKKLDEITPDLYPQTTGGTGATAQAVLDSDGRVTSITVTNGGSGYSREFLPSVQIQGAATATAIVDNGQITGFKITYPGEGYAVAPEIKIISNGFGKLVGDDASSTALNRSHIKSAGGSLIATAYSGIGSGSKPLKTDVENMVAQTFEDGGAIYVLEKDGLRIGLMDHINGVQTANGDVAITTFGGTISLGQPVQQMNASGELLWQDANKTIPIYARDENGRIIYKGGRLATVNANIKLTADDIDINSYVSSNGGKLTVQPTQPDAKIGLNGTQARAKVAITDGQITGVSELWSGRGYTSLPLVTIAPPGERAFGVANVLNGELKNINVTFGGTKYNADHPPTITLVGGGLNGGAPTTPAVVTPVYADGVVTGVTIVSAGAGYYTAPEVRFALPGTQATATAQVINGRVSEIQILNPGSNYTGDPEIKISAPYQFSLEKEEVDYLQSGFDNVIIGRADGRHTFHSADAGFVDGVTLRGPRDGGTVELENLRSSDGPVVIIGSGHTLNLTTASPFVTGTFVEIDDNIVVHDDANAVITGTSSYVSIFGAGKGKIDGVAGSDDENLTINDVGNVLVTGAIGSTHPINDFTINSSGSGTINLQQTVALEGDLHIIKGGDISFGGNMTIGGDLIIDEGASVSFAGTVTVGGNLIIRNATTVTFAKNVSAGGNVAIGEVGDPSKIGGVTFASTARLDAGGGVEIYTTDEIVFGNRIGQTTAPIYMTLRSDLSDISFQSSVNVPAGALTIIKARDVTFAQEITTSHLDIQDASGQTRLERASVVGTMDVTSTALVQIKNRLDVTDGSATLTTNDVDFSGGNGSINYTGNTISTLTIRPRTLSRDITIGSPPGVFSSLDISDIDLAAIGATFTELAIGNAGNGTGTVTIGSIGSQQGAGNSQLVTSTRIYGGTVNVVQAIDSAAASGFLKLAARTGNININARINGTAVERNAEIELETLAGNVNLNQPVHATDELRIFSFGTVTEGANAFVDVPNLAIVAGGAVTMNHASNSVSTLAMDVANQAIQFRNDTAFEIGTVDVVSGVSSGTANTTLTSVGGVVTQTQPITANGLLLNGTGGTFNLNNGSNNVGTLAADTQVVSYHDVDDLIVGMVGAKAGITTVGATTVVAGGAIAVNRPIITTSGNIVLDANGGSITASSNGDLSAGGLATITLDATEDITLDDATSGGGLTANAGNAMALNGIVSAGGDVALVAADGTFAQADDTSITAAGAVTISATESVAMQTIDSAGNLSATAGTGITVGGVLATTASGNVSLTAQAGDIAMATGAAINSDGLTTLNATGDISTDKMVSAGLTTVSAGGKIDINDEITTTTGAVAIGATAGAVTMADDTIITSASTLAIDAGTSILAMQLNAGGNAGLVAGTGMSIVDGITTTNGGSLDIEALNGSIAMNADAIFNINGNVEMDATENLALSRINAVGNLSGDAGDAIVLTNLLNIAGTVTLDAHDGNLSMTGAAAIQSGDDATLRSADDVLIRDVVASGELLVVAENAIDVAVRASASNGGGVTFDAQGGDITMAVDSLLQSSGVLAMTASQRIQVTDVYANNNATLTAGTSVTIDERIETDNSGTLTITAQGGDITMSDGSQLVADGDTVLSATTTITTESVAVAGDLTMNAAGAIEAQGDITTTDNGDIAITSSTSTFTQSADTTITSDRTVGIIATTATIETVVAAGTVDVDASADLLINEAIQTTGTGAVNLSATSGAVAMSSDSVITSAGAVDIDAGTTATIQSLDAAGAVTIDATGAVTINEAIATTAGGTVDITSTGGAIVMADNSTLISSGDTTLTASTTITTETVTVAGDLTELAGAAIESQGDITTTASGNVLITSTASTFTQSAGTTITSAGTTTINATTATIETINGTGLVTVAAADAIALNEAIHTTGGNVVLGATSGAVAMSSDSEISTVGDIEIDAATTAILQTIDAAGNVDVSAPGGIVINDAIATTANGTVDLAASAGAIEMADDTQIVSADDVTLTAQTAIDLVDVTASGDLSATAGTGMTIDGQITTTNGGTVEMTATAGQFLMETGSTITADGDVDIHSGTGAAITTISAAGDVSVMAGNGVNVSGTIGTTADGHVTIDANNGAIVMAPAANIDADGDAILTASGSISASDVVADDEIQMTAQTSITLAGAVASTNGPVVINAQNGDLVMVEDTSIHSGGLVTMTAAGDISSETISAGGNLTMAAGQGLTINGGLTTTAGGNVSLTADDGSIVMVDPAYVAAAGALTITASQDVTTQGIAAGADISITATDDAILEGDVETDQDLLVVTQAGSISQATGSQIVVGGGVDLQSAGTISTNRIDAVGNVIINGEGNVTINHNIQSRSGTMEINSDTGNVLVLGGRLESAGQTTIDSSGVAQLLDVSAGGLLIHSNSNTTLGGLVTTTNNGGVTINAMGTLFIADAANISSDGAVTLGAAGGIVSSADIGTSNDDITILSRMTLGDDITFSTGRRGAGSIMLNNTIDGDKSMTVRAASNLLVSGAVGQTTPLSHFNILSAQDVVLSGAMTAGRIDQQIGSGTTLISGTLAATAHGGLSIANRHIDMTGAIGTTSNVPINLEAETIDVTRSARLWAGGRLAMTANALKMLNGYRVGVTGGGEMVLSADQIDLGSRSDAIAGDGLLVLQPISTSAPIVLGGGATSGFHLSQDEINTLGVGFRKVIIGRGSDLDHYSGSIGSHAVTINDISFRSPVSVRSQDAGGAISVNGSLTTQGRLRSIWLSAGGDVAVHGQVAIGRSGHVFITADADGNSRGAVRVGETSNASITTPSGNILLVGPAIRAGGARSAPNIVSANSSVFLGTTGSRSTVVITNPKTNIAGNDVLFGGNGRVHPVLISIEGNITTTEDLNLYSSGDIKMSDFRLIGDDTLNLLADNNVIAENGTLIGRNGMVQIKPDFDRNGTGSPTVTNVRLSQPSPLDLRSRISEVRLPVTVTPGVGGEAYVAVGNNTNAEARGLVYVHVYASADGKLDASDRILGTARQRIALQPGQATTFRVRLQLPSDLPVGSYRIVAEAMPYAQVDNPQGSNIDVGGLVRVVAA